jgi:hypothetical protein
MKRLVALVVVPSFLFAACYNSYDIPRSELLTLQGSESGMATVKDIKGREVQVKDDSRLYVRSKGGKRYPITPFNFKVTESQLVASDRDYILDLGSLRDEAEVDKVSVWKTSLLIGAGVAAVAGLIVVTVLTAGKKSLQD